MISRLTLIAAAFSLSLLGADAVVEKAKQQVEDKKFDEAITALESAYKAKPKSDELQKALAETHMAKADFFMFNKEMPPFRKYPAALRSYRKVLEYDDENKKAKENISTIEGIYKSMGRPVPK